MASAPMDLLIDSLKHAFDASQPKPEQIKQLLAEYIAAGHDDYKVRAFLISVPYAARNESPIPM